MIGPDASAGLEAIVSEREPEETDLREGERRLAFQTLMSELSATFISLPASEVESRIDEALRILGEYLGVDRTYVIEFNEGGTLRATHTWGSFDWDPFSFRAEVELPWLTARLLRGDGLVLSRWEDDLPPEAVDVRAHCEQRGLRSVVLIPLSVGGSVIGAVRAHHLRAERRWAAEDVQQIRLVTDVIGNALTRKRQEDALRAALSEVETLRDRLQRENVYLREEIRVQYNHEKIIGHGEAIRRVLGQAEQVAATDSTVLLLGETGTGKELMARTIHHLSARGARPMVKVNCAALPATLVEAELFGREKGAYTGALTRQSGRFEVADGSTILLDEIGELSLELQAKLLGVLQDGQFERLGSTRPITVDVRVIAATNRDLAKAVTDGKFREDLYYRLNVFPIRSRRSGSARRTSRNWCGRSFRSSGRRPGRRSRGSPARRWTRSRATRGPAMSANCVMSSSAR